MSVTAYEGPVLFRNPTGDLWPSAYAKLEVHTNKTAYLVLSSKADGPEVDRVKLEVTSSVFETTLGENTFEVITYAKIVHLSVATLDMYTAWKQHLKDCITSCSPFPTDAIYKEALQRQQMETYELIHADNKPLGIVLERAGEWAQVKVALHDSVGGVKLGSVLHSINDTPVLLKPYPEAINILKGWTPPLKLTFVKLPEKKGYLTRQIVQWKNRATGPAPVKVVWKKRYFSLENGCLSFYSDATMSKGIGQINLFGSMVSLMAEEELGRPCCFRVLSGISSLILQADSVYEMYEWACALYFGMAIANGGGYVFSMVSYCAATGKSQKDLLDEALKQDAAKPDSKPAEVEKEEDAAGATVTSSRALMEKMQQKEDVLATVFEAASLAPSETAEMEEAEASEYQAPEEAAEPPRERDEDAADLAKVFRFYEKFSDELSQPYISVAQFSIIFRLVTGVKGNLYKEMQMFNQFDGEGKGMLVESDFVDGWLSLSSHETGETLIKNLKKLVDKPDNMLL